MFLLVQYLSDEKIVTSRDIRQNVYVLLTELYILVLDLMLLSDFAIFRVEFAWDGKVPNVMLIRLI